MIIEPILIFWKIDVPPVLVFGEGGWGLGVGGGRGMRLQSSKVHYCHMKSLNETDTSSFGLRMCSVFTRTTVIDLLVNILHSYGKKLRCLNI